MIGVVACLILWHIISHIYKALDLDRREDETTY